MKIWPLILLFCAFNLKLSSTNYENLFIIERSRDADQILYKVELDNEGNLNTKDPISVNWCRRTNNNEFEPLTWVQQKFSYGLSYLIQEPDRVVFQFKAYDKRVFELKKDAKGVFKVYSLSKGKQVEVNRIFIQIDGGTFWFPTISRVELHGNLADQDLKHVEVIKP